MTLGPGMSVPSTVEVDWTEPIRIYLRGAEHHIIGCAVATNRSDRTYTRMEV